MTHNAYVLHDDKVVVFWAPKSGCTSIVRVLFEQYFGQSRYDSNGDLIQSREWLEERGCRVDWRTATGILSGDSGYRSLALLRDPYERLVSAFINKFCTYLSQPLLTVDALEPFARELVRDVQRGRGVADTRIEVAKFSGLSFKEFCEHVCGAITDRSTEEPDLDLHWNTQVPLAFRNEGHDYDFAYQLGNFEMLLAKLGELTGRRLHDERVNATDYSRFRIFPTLVDVGSVEIAGSRVSPRQFSNRKLRDLVKIAYAVDYSYLAAAC